jgi:DivIVA protein
MSYFGNPTEPSDPGQTAPFEPFAAEPTDDVRQPEAFEPPAAAEPPPAFEPPSAFEPVYAGTNEPIAGDEAGESFGHSVGARLADFRERVVRALHNLDRGPVEHPQLEAGTEHHELLSQVPPRSDDARLPIGPLGYSRGAVDERIAALEQEIVTLEQELQELRDSKAPVSITEEIERLGEQTASILVVAHGQANETTRKAQEDAERCLADAALNANLLTEEAKRRLEQIDTDTDAVWQERARLLDDARGVGLALIALAEEAQERFPPEVKTSEVPQAAD